MSAKSAPKWAKKICKPLFRDLHFLCELFRSRIIKFYVIWLKNGVFRLFAHSFRPRPPFKPIFSFSMIFHILLQVSDTAATARILEQQMALQVGEYSIQDTTSVKIFKTTIDREALVRELTLQGVGLSGLAEKDDTLEDYFKKITGGEGIA